MRDNPQWCESILPPVAAVVFPRAELIEKKWFHRVIAVACDDASFLIRYNGRGLGTEYVYVDDVLVVRRSRGNWLMSHGFRFSIGERHWAALSVAIPWWCEVFPFSDLSFMRLEVDGVTVYQEGEAPKRPLKWTSSASGFPVILPSHDATSTH
jgi:hypothetical protein